MHDYRQPLNGVFGQLLSAANIGQLAQGVLQDWPGFAVGEEKLITGDMNMKMLTINQLCAVAAGVWEGENGEGCIPNPIKIGVKSVF